LTLYSLFPWQRFHKCHRRKCNNSSNTETLCQQSQISLEGGVLENDRYLDSSYIFCCVLVATQHPSHFESAGILATLLLRFTHCCSDAAAAAATSDYILL
jgi:hypothetical protein